MQTQGPTCEDIREPASPDVPQPGLLGLFGGAPLDVPARLTQQAVQLSELRAVVDQLRAERDRLVAQQRQVAELIRCSHPEKLVHDLRNVLNELQLYKMLAETQA